MHRRWAPSCLVALALLAHAAGCGPPPSERPDVSQSDLAANRKTAAPAAIRQPPAKAIKPPELVASDDPPVEKARPPLVERTVPVEAALIAEPATAPAAAIDEKRVEAHGIRKLSSNRLTLYTDLPLDDEIKALPEAFDQAYPQWRNYFGLTQRAETPWRAVGRLMKDEEKFRAAGLLPDDLPQFLHGYTLGNNFWWREQSSAYFRRHLMLHEGTHSFMFAHFGTCGPPWYMEGIAELLATHSWGDGKLKLDIFPASREQVPYWGRIKIVRDAVAAHKAYRLDEVLNFAPGLHSTAEPYGWCWATAAFLDGHPRYRQRFRQLPSQLKEAKNFNRRFKVAYSEDWSDLDEELQSYILDLEYGYDLVRNASDFAPGMPLPASGGRVAVAAARGWQASGIRLEAGKTYTLRARGRYQLGQQPQIWWSEPNGVTLRYYGGRPLGVLMAVVHPDPYDPVAVSSLLSPTIVGLSAELKPTESGTLYLRINDSPADLADNVGEAEVEISAN